jgi:TPR repeat protein
MRPLLVLLAVVLLLPACRVSSEPRELTYDEVMESIARVAERGDTSGAVNYEILKHRNGHDSKSLNRIQGHALLGNASAATAMADIYMHGWGVEADFDEAIRWLRIAAADGDERARHMLLIYTGRTN